MIELFAEAFTEPLQEPECARAAYCYDEALALNVLPDGRTAVEHASAGQTQTVTKASGEHDDRDEDTTITEAEAETDTWWTAMTGTHTAVKAEADDFASLPRLDTITRVSREADDWAS